MAIPAGLIAKSLVGVGTAAAATTLGVVYKDNISNFFSKMDIETLGKKVGLTCSSNGGTTECTFKKDETVINIWKANDDYKTGAKVTADDKKVKFEKSQGYNFGFKFTVDSEISLSGGTDKKASGGISKLSSSNKSYEIKEQEIDANDKKWFLVEKES